MSAGTPTLGVGENKKLAKVDAVKSAFASLHAYRRLLAVTACVCCITVYLSSNHGHE